MSVPSSTPYIDRLPSCLLSAAMIYAETFCEQAGVRPLAVALNRYDTDAESEVFCHMSFAADDDAEGIAHLLGLDEVALGVHSGRFTVNDHPVTFTVASVEHAAWYPTSAY